MRAWARLSILGVVLVIEAATPAWALREVPAAPSSYVIDEPGVLSGQSRAALGEYLSQVKPSSASSSRF